MRFMLIRFSFEIFNRFIRYHARLSALYDIHCTWSLSSLFFYFSSHHVAAMHSTNCVIERDTKHKTSVYLGTLMRLFCVKHCLYLFRMRVFLCFFTQLTIFNCIFLLGNFGHHANSHHMQTGNHNNFETKQQ